MDALDESALVKILTQPKNAVIRQYKKLFDMDGVDVEFEDDALIEVASMAIRLKTGARGLRSVLESIMLELMYDIPTDDTVKKVIVTKGVVTGEEKPTVIRK